MVFWSKGVIILTHNKAVTSKGNKMVTYFLREEIIWLNYYVDGKRIRKSTKLKNTSENIKVVERQIIPQLAIKIASGDIYKKKPKTFRYYGNIFLASKEDNKTYFLKCGYWKRVIEYFGDRNIDEITRLHVKQYLTSLDMKSKSKNSYKSCVKEIFELAVDDEVLENNPALNITLKADIKHPIEYYTREEVYKILSVADGIIRPYLLIAFNTGMRAGEILGLQIGDFKDDGFIHIKRTRTKGIIGNGKTGNAIRKVPYSKEIFDSVKLIKSNNIFLFDYIDDSSLLRSQWLHVTEKAGVRRLRLYATRHTFATIMLKEKIVSLNELAGLLGHSTAKVTLQHYASVINADLNSLDSNFSLFGGHNTVTVKKEESFKSL
jgi:integrase